MRWLIGLWTIMVLGCGGTNREQPREPSHWLELMDEAAASAELAVVMASPQGNADSSNPITVEFNHPMRSMTLAENYAPPPIQITPPVAGVWQWVGTNAVTLVSDRPVLAPANHYRVTVSGATRDVAGQQLGMPYVFEFETERPQLIDSINPKSLGYYLLSSEPPKSNNKFDLLAEHYRESDPCETATKGRLSQETKKGHDDLRLSPEQLKAGIGAPVVLLNDSLLLLFNLPVAPQTIVPYIILSTSPLSADQGETLAAVPFELTARCPKSGRVVTLKPRRPLPKGSLIHVTATPGLKSTVGELPSIESKVFTYKTFGRFTASLNASPEQRYGCRGPFLSFTNQLHLEQLNGALLITPNLPFSAQRYKDDRTYCVDAEFDESKTYTIGVKRSLTDVFHQTLEGQNSWQVRIPKRATRSQILIGARSGFLDPAQPGEVWIETERISKLDVTSVALGPPELVAWFQRKEPEEKLPEFLLQRAGTHASFSPGQGFWSGKVSLLDAIKPNRFGTVGLLVQADAQPPQARLLHPTNLALTSLISANQALVRVTKLSNGRAVAQARLVAFNSDTSVNLGTTGPDGLAMLGSDAAAKLSNKGDAVLLVAQKGQDWSYLETGCIEAPASDLHPTGSVFVDRGIYRPGEPIYVKGWLRRQTDTGSEPLTNAPVKLALHAPSSVPGADVLAKRETKTNEFGGFDCTLPTPKTASLGVYSVTAEGGEQTLSTQLRLGQFRFVEYLARAEAEEKSAIRGQPVHFGIKADYLFGAPVNGAHVQYSAWCSQERLQIADGFAIDTYTSDDNGANCPSTVDSDPGDDPRRGTGSQRARLDEHGQHRATLTAAPFSDGPTTMIFDAGVRDASQQVVAARASILLHPASFYLGIRSRAGSLRVGGTLTADVIAVDHDGRRIGGKSGKIELWAHTESTEDNAQDKLIGSCKVVTSKTSLATCSIALTQPGPHRLVVSGADEQGRVMRAGEHLWISGTNWPSSPTTAQQEPNITLDREKYLPGDMAHARIDLPWPNSELLVVLMTDRVIWHKTMTATGRQVMLDIPVTRNVVRNAGVIFYATAGRRGPLPQSNSVGDELQPQVATAMAEFVIDPDFHRLSVDLLPDAAVVAPGATIGVTLRVSDRQGNSRRAEVALAASDEGALALTNDSTPDPLDSLLGKRNEGMGYGDTRSHAGRIFRLSGHPSDFAQTMSSSGGELSALGVLTAGGNGTNGLRGNFAGTVYFNPHLVTGSDGTAHVQLKLGDATTSYRLTAVAVSTPGEVGSTNTSVRTQQPLMMRPALPRFLREGDRVNAGLIVMNQTDGVSDVTVTLAPQGVTSRGPLTRQVTVLPRGSSRIEFPLLAQKVGNANLRFNAQAGTYSDAVNLPLSIQLASRLQTVASYGHTNGTALEQLGDLTAARRDQGKLEVQVSSTALTGIDRSLEQLADDHYLSAEHLAGRILTEVLLGDLKKAYGIVPASDPERTTQLILRLLALQGQRGSFAMWERNSEAQPWLSVYALLALETAHSSGLSVPAPALEAARRYAQKLLVETRPALLEAIGPFAAYVLSRSSHATWQQLFALWQRRKQLPYPSKTLLLEAFANYRDSKGAVSAQRQSIIKELTDALIAPLHFDGPKVTLPADKQTYHEHFDSNNRSLAMALSALLSADPKHPAAERLAHTLLAARENGLWRSTQETCFALLALEKYRRLREPRVPPYSAKVWLEGRPLGEVHQQDPSLRAQNFTVPMQQLGTKGDRLLFELQSPGTLYYETRLSYVPSQLPTAGLDRGLLVTHGLYRVLDKGLPEAVLKGTAPGETQFALGNVVVGRVIVTTPTLRDYVVIEVPLPAGLEALDGSLETSFTSGELLAGLASEPVSHRELRDDRIVYYVSRLPPGKHRYHYVARVTSSGSFVVPPVRAQELYAPEVFGRTGAVNVEVK